MNGAVITEAANAPAKALLVVSMAFPFVVLLFCRATRLDDSPLAQGVDLVVRQLEETFVDFGIVLARHRNARIMTYVSSAELQWEAGGQRASGIEQVGAAA